MEYQWRKRSDVLALAKWEVRDESGQVVAYCLTERDARHVTDKLNRR